jgi:transposase InsO family protein
MPWRGSVEDQRRVFLAELTAVGSNRRAVCRRWGVSAKTAYKWLKRYEAAGEEGLSDQSRRPRSSPGQTSEAVAAQVFAVRDEHPAWGARKIEAVLERRGVEGVPAASTITQILRRGGRLGPVRERPVTVGRFERAKPNELWQMDFKGHFRLGNGTRCHPLLIVDDHSRHCMAARACENERGETVQAELGKVFREYGLPEEMLMDNGSPWGNDAMHVYTPFVAWLIRLMIHVSHGRPRHPQTQGKTERLNRTVGEEYLALQTGGFGENAEVQVGMNGWRRVYNEERPHEALGMAVPADRYRASERAMPERLPAIEYEAGDVVRKVQDGGRIGYGGREWRLPKAFRGLPVALRPTEEEGKMAAYFCQQRIAELDLTTGKVQVVRG